MIGNGSHIQCHGFCSDVSLSLHSTTFNIPFFVLPIKGADVVLGMQWLGSLGPIVADFSVPQMSFQHKGHTITLSSEPISTPVTPSTLHHLMQKGSIASMHTIIFQHYSTTLTSTTPSNTDPQIQQILSEFSHIFEPPTTLPPPRTHDHHIPLTPNTPPVNVRPYRYPYYQKQIMTELISDMLKQGLIKSSNSPYSSPRSFGSKKRWHMAFLCRLPSAKCDPHS